MSCHVAHTPAENRPARRYTESERLLGRAVVIPGRSLTRSKAPGRLFDIDAGPLYAATASGAEITDVDGHNYIDMICALGAIGLGYSARPMKADAQAAVGHGWIYSLPHKSEIDAAEQILQHVAPWATHVRVVKTGSEATHAAYRIAKAKTGRPHVLVGDWAYHGWHEWCHHGPRYPHRFEFGNGGYFTLRYPDRSSTFANEAIAAVFVEPHRWEPVDVAWLQQVRQWCTDAGALLVFDEMIYGGRWALGGATEYFGVTPDLACYGKAIGNGAPIACVVGRDALAEHGELVSGTYSGDAAALAACVEVIRTYKREPVIDTLWTRGRQLRRGLLEAADVWIRQRPDPMIAVRVEGQPVHQRLRFEDFRTEAPQNSAAMLGRRFAAAMAKRGVLWHPDCVNISFAHTEAHIERVVEAAMASMVEIGRTT